MGPSYARWSGGLLGGLLLALPAAGLDPQIVCSTTSSPLPVRASGLTEVLPDILLSCVSEESLPSVVREDLNLTVSITLSTAITNPIVESGARPLVDALLSVNGNVCADPSGLGSTFGSCGAPQPHVQDQQYGRLTSTGVLQWARVSVPFPGALSPRATDHENPSVSTVRLEGIRANITQVGLSATGGASGPPLSAAVRVSSGAPVVLLGGTVDLAYPRPGLVASVTPQDKGRACLGEDRGTATVRLLEGFPRALGAASDREAEHPASRLLLEVREVPDGVAVTVPSFLGCRQPEFDGAGSGTADRLTLGLVSGHRPDGQGGTANASASAGMEAVRLSAGAGTAVYEVLSDDPSRIEDCHLPVGFAAQSGTVSGISARIGAGLAPESRVFVASGFAPVPRFQSVPVSQEETVGFAGCGTTLLFPFVTNQAGFTTGLVVTHGSEEVLAGDASGAVPAACSLHYFGATAQGEPIRLVQDSAPIEEGDQLVFSLSSGSPEHGIVGVNQFQGYLMATCSRPDVRGYAFISDGFGGIADLAMGYLAPAVPLDADGRRLVQGDRP